MGNLSGLLNLDERAESAESALPQKGQYVFRVTSSEVSSPKTGLTICTLGLQFESGVSTGKSIEEKFFLRSDNASWSDRERKRLTQLAKYAGVVEPEDSSLLHHKSFLGEVIHYKTKNGDTRFSINPIGAAPETAKALNLADDSVPF